MFMYTRNGYDASHCWKVFVLSVKTSVNQKKKKMGPVLFMLVKLLRLISTRLQMFQIMPTHMQMSILASNVEWCLPLCILGIKKSSS